MKVLMQEWRVPDGGQLISISKDRGQLDATVKEVTAKKSEDEHEEIPEVDGEHEEIEIPNDSVFVEMVKMHTIFLHDDEMDIIYDALNVQG